MQQTTEAWFSDMARAVGHGVNELVHRLREAVEAGPATNGDAQERDAQDEPVEQARWSVSTRLGAASVGSALLALGLARRGTVGRLAGGVGAGLLLSALIKKPVWQLLGIGAGRRAVDITKTVVIDAPVEEVFGIWRDFESFPLFMQHVSEVTPLEGRRSHWVVQGPAGSKVEWDAEMTVCLPNERVGWKTLPDQGVEHAGTVRFAEVLGGKTRLDIHLSYNPPAGRLGHLVAQLFGADPKAALDDDMARLQDLLEDRRTGVDQTGGQAPSKCHPSGGRPSGDQETGGRDMADPVTNGGQGMAKKGTGEGASLDEGSGEGMGEAGPGVSPMDQREDRQINQDDVAEQRTPGSGMSGGEAPSG